MNTQQTTITPAQTVAEMAVSMPGALSVFSKHNIDYCCGGHRSLGEACMRLGLNPEKIMSEIHGSPGLQLNHTLRFKNWSSSLLIDYIVENHHAYIKKAIPDIQFFLDKVCSAHGDEDIQLLSIRQDFQDLAEELTSHMNKEEFVLFPAIKRLETNEYGNLPLTITLRSPLQAMEDEHEIAGELIKSIRNLSNNYTTPGYACPTYWIAYQKLQEFDADLIMHIHLENNILFERVKSKATPSLD